MSKGIAVLASDNVTKEEVDSILDSVLQRVNEIKANGTKEGMFKHEDFIITYGVVKELGESILIDK